jgi:nucleoside phosphorylase
MTGALGQRLLAYEPGRFAFDLSRAHPHDQSAFESGLPAVRDKILHRENLAITRDLLESNRGSHSLTKGQIDAASRIISALYMGEYAGRRSLRVCTGIPDFPFTEIFDGFPAFDFPLLDGLIVLLVGRRKLDAFDLEDICSCYASEDHQRFGYYLEAFLESSLNAVKSQVNLPGSLQALRALVMQFLRRELDVGTLLSSGTLSEFYIAASQRLLEFGQRIAKSNGLFSEKWREYVPEYSAGLILITTATDTEDAALFSALHESGFSRTTPLKAGAGFVQEFGRGLRDRVVHLRTSAGSMGVNSAGGTLPPVIASLQPDYIISAGICFGLKPAKYEQGKQELGDVIISGHVQDYESERLGRAITPRGERLPAGAGLLQAARIARDNTASDSWKCYEGLVLSGQKLVDDEAFVVSLRSRFPDAIAGEMEGNAVAGASNYAGKQWIIVKGICDWGMNKEDGWQEKAASRACRLALDAALIVLSSN